MNIGLTGGIATGKSTVSRMLVRLGAKLIDADLIAREVMQPGHSVLAAVAERFGQAMLLPDGSLNRKKLGEHVFTYPEERKALDAITHPSIRREIKKRMEAYEAEDMHGLVVADVPLLYESGQESMYEQVMVVYVPRELQLRRLMERDRLDLLQAEARLAAQMDIEMKRERADIIIDNSRGLEDTEAQVRAYWQSRVCS